MAIQITLKNAEGLSLETMENLVKFQACCAVTAETAAYSEQSVRAEIAKTFAHLPRAARRAREKQFATDWAYFKRVVRTFSRMVEVMDADYYDELLDQTFGAINSVNVANE